MSILDDAEVADNSVASAAGNEAANDASDPYRSYQWYLDGAADNGVGANVEAVSSEYTGRGVVVGIIDEGFDTNNPDLFERFDLARSYDPRDLGVTSITPDSASTVHGTWVAGVLGAEANNDFGIAGVASGATLAGFYARFGFGGSMRQELAGLLARQVNVDVANSSWGYTTEFADNFRDPAWSLMAEALRAGVTEGRAGLGTVYVFAAGNDRQYVPNTITYDGDNTNYHSLTNNRFVITTAASTEDGHVAPFSTPGASILVTAPGTSIVTTTVGNGGGDSADNFAFVSGTSLAAPIVSGVVAMMFEANPHLGYRDVQDILALSARKIDSTSESWASNGATNWNGGGNLVSHDFGFGLVDAHAAVRLAETWSGTHAAANEATIAVVGDVGNDRDLIDFEPRSYTATVPASLHDFSVQWVEIDITILHDHVGDLKINLISPTGTDSVLMDMPSDGNNSRTNLNFTFTTNHNWGKSAAGTWTLIVEDAGSGGTGSLESFALRFYGDTTGDDTAYYYTDDFGTLSGDRGTIIDAAGNDTVNAVAVTSSLTIDLHPGAVSTIAGRIVTISPDTIIENVRGGDGDDVLTGNDAGNHLYGGRGDDTIHGGSGNDTIEGGRGADVMVGGGGSDTYVVDNPADVIVENPEEGTDAIIASISYMLGASVENLTLTGWDNLEGAGNELDNVIISNNGVNTLIGGDGNDTFVIHHALDRIVETSTGGIDTVFADVSYAIAENVEVLILIGTANLDAVGNADDNTLIGNTGNNRFDGGIGADTLEGGAGNDTYIVDNAGDLLIEESNNGTDSVIAGVSYALSANVENLTLSGSADLAGIGNELDNIIVSNFGVDALTGGDGNDIYFVHNSADQINETATGGHDTVYADVSFALPTNVEILILLAPDHVGGRGLFSGPQTLNAGASGSPAYLNGVGNELDNTIVSSGGDDILTGGVGADTFVFGVATPSDQGAILHVITDYDQGNGGGYNAVEGDQIDLSGLLSSAVHQGSGQSLGTLVRAVASDAGAYLQIDADGVLNGNNWITVARLDGLHAGDVINVIVDSAQSAGSALSVLGSLPTRDFNADGKSDILYWNDGGSLWLSEMDGAIAKTGNFVTALADGWHIDGTSDFNGDGKSDLLLRNDDGALWLAEMNGPNIAAGASVGSLATGWHIEGTADFNGDGKSDILYGSENGALWVSQMEGPGVIAGGSVGSLTNGWHIGGIADFDGDGKSDILYQNDDGALWMSQMDGLTTRAGGFVTTLADGWHIAGLADFNGDHKSDMLLRNDNGGVWLAETDGFAVKGGGMVGTVDPTWHVATTADFDGDSLADILWHNDDGSLWLSKMDGFHVVGGGFVGAIDSTWHVTGHQYDVM